MFLSVLCLHKHHLPQSSSSSLDSQSDIPLHIDVFGIHFFDERHSYSLNVQFAVMKENHHHILNKKSVRKTEHKRKHLQHPSSSDLSKQSILLLQIKLAKRSFAINSSRQVQFFSSVPSSQSTFRSQRNEKSMV